MIFISSLFNSVPSSAKDLLEFSFFLTVGFTTGSRTLMKTYLIAISLFGIAIITTAIAPTIAYAL